MLDELQDELSLPSADFVARLADAFHYPVLSLQEMQQLQLASDALPYAESVRRECVAFEGEAGVVIAAAADPFDSDLQAWVGEHFRGPVMWHLAQRDDIVAYLARFEETMRAMDGMFAAVESGAGKSGQVE